MVKFKCIASWAQRLAYKTILSFAPTLLTITLIDLFTENELATVTAKVWSISPFLAMVTILTTFLTIWFFLGLFIAIYKYFINEIEVICEEFSVIDHEGESVKFQNFAIKSTMVIKKLKKALVTLRKISIISIFYLIFAWVNASNLAHAESAGASERIGTAADSLNTNIRALTLNDYSMNLLKLLWGSALLEAQENALSLDRIMNSLGASKNSGGGSAFEQYADDVADGLDLSWFEDVSTIDNATGQVIGTTTEIKNSALRPDSPMGWMLAVLGWLFVVLVVIAAIYRMLATLSSSLMEIEDNKSAITKMVTFQFASAFAAILITLPLYKGFNLFCLMFITMQVIGVAVANFFILGLFTQVMMAGLDDFTAPSNAIDVFQKVSGRVVCSMALNASSAGVGTNSQVVNYASSIETSSGNSTIDFGRCGKLIFTAEKGGWFSDMVDDYYDSSPQLRIDDLIGAEKVEMLETKVNAFYQLAIKELIQDVGLIYNKALEENVNIEGLTEACASYDANISQLNPNENDEDIKVMQEKAQGLQRQCYKSNDNIPYMVEEAQLKFNSSYRDIVKYVANEATKETKKKSTQDMRESIDINDASTYGIYKSGWMLYPFYSALQVMRAQSLAGLVKYDITEVDYNLGQDEYLRSTGWGSSRDNARRIEKAAFANLNRAEAAFMDAHRAEVVMQALNSLAVRNAATGDWTTMLTKWGDVGNEGFNVGAVMNMPPEMMNAGGDADLVNAVVLWVADMVIADDGYLIPKLTNTGHWFLNIAMIGKAAEGVFSVVKGGEKSGFVSKAVRKLNPATWIAGAAAAGALKPVMEKLYAFYDQLYYVGTFLAYLVPMIPAYFMALCIVKWLGQVIKASTITAIVPLKIFNSEGNDLLAKGSAEIVMLAVVVAAFPTLITGVNFTIERLAAPLASILQGMAFNIFTLTQANFVIGPTAAIVLVAILAAIPILVLLYLYSLPLYLMDSIPQLLSLNLSVGGMNSNLAEMGQLSRAAKMLSLGGGGNKPPDGAPPASGAAPGAAPGAQVAEAATEKNKNHENIS